MIAGRLRQRFAEQDWFSVAIEIAIVVVGVFLGLQANNWNEDRLERGRAHHARQQLIADLKNNEHESADAIAYYTQVRRHAQAALAAWRGPATTLGEQFLIDASQASQNYTVVGMRFGYEALSSAGELDLLGDLGVRAGNYYSLLTNVIGQVSNYPAYRERLRRLLPNDVEQAIRAGCGDVDTTEADGFLFSRMPTRCTARLTPDAVQRGVASVRTAPDLDLDLNRQIGFLDGTRKMLAANRERARTLRVAIERADR